MSGTGTCGRMIYHSGLEVWNVRIGRTADLAALGAGSGPWGAGPADCGGEVRPGSQRQGRSGVAWAMDGNLLPVACWRDQGQRQGPAPTQRYTSERSAARSAFSLAPLWQAKAHRAFPKPARIGLMTWSGQALCRRSLLLWVSYGQAPSQANSFGVCLASDRHDPSPVILMTPVALVCLVSQGNLKPRFRRGFFTSSTLSSNSLSVSLAKVRARWARFLSMPAAASGMNYGEAVSQRFLALRHSFAKAWGHRGPKIGGGCGNLESHILGCPYEGHVPSKF
jgi:hypothetical protein